MTLQILLTILAQLSLPVVLMTSLLRWQCSTRLDWYLLFLLNVTYLIFVSSVGQVWIGVGIYIKYLFWIALIAVSFSSYRKVKSKKFDSQEPRANSLRGGVVGMLALTFLALDAYVLTGYFHSEDEVDLEFPLNSGIYYINHGGSNSLINSHGSQKHALDIVALNGFGMRASGIKPTNLEAYEIFGHKIYSPCTGTVVDIVSNLEDSLDPQFSRDQFENRRERSGNHLVIHCNEVYVVMSHLKKGSMTVLQGEDIVTGQLLGAVGNNGNSDEPHFHIQAIKRQDGAPIYSGDGVAIRFNDRYLVRNSLYVSRNANRSGGTENLF